jgi:zinc and cadmium transporter
MTLFYILGVTFISSLISLLGSFFLARKQTWPKKFVLQLTAFASGVLLTTSFLHLAPEAAESLDPQTVFMVIFLSIILFFVMERLILWHHHHEDEECCGPKPSAWFITIGDGVHNFLDGILIAGTFLVSPSLGLLTAFAVSAHEIPQEIADFSVMVAGGMSRSRALFLNFVSAMAAVLGALITYFFAFSLDWLTPYIIAASAGMFLYIALSDLIPELHHHDLGQKQVWKQLMVFFVGVLLIVGVSALADI